MVGRRNSTSQDFLVSRNLLIEMYEKMLTIRKFEEKVDHLLREGVLPGFAHLYIGEEAVAVGVVSALDRDDLVLSTHRGHGHCIAKGADIRKMMAELFGKTTGYCHGKGGSMHITGVEVGILGANGIVGANIPIAGGAGLAAKMRGEKQVVVAFFGDGAANTGAFHEGLNLASLWKVPVVYVCENNLYAVSVAQSRSTAIPDISKRADAYGIPGESVDGMDAVSVYESAMKAAERARKGLGPSLIECRTYRFYGHYSGEGKLGITYRSDEEVRKWKKRDPLIVLGRKLREMYEIRTQDLAVVETRVEKAIEEAVEFAKSGPSPNPGEVWVDLFYEEDEED